MSQRAELIQRQTYCEGCGRDGLKPHRVYREKPYCAACYKRLFVRSFCPGCDNLARLPSFDPRAVCQTCTAALPCIHCKRTGRPIGRLTTFGPVCDSCSPIFRQQAPCDRCGRLSGKLSRKGQAPERLCPTCLSRATKATCQACRRSRVLEPAPDGRQLCRVCLNEGERTCDLCGQTMPAGRGKTCETCDWKAALKRRIATVIPAFTTTEMATTFSEFGAWLGEEISPMNAANKLKRYLWFFTDMETRWGGLPMYDLLLARHSAEGLRRVGLPMRWLAAVKQIRPDPVLRERDSEERRIKVLLGSLPPESSAEGLLRSYHQRLLERLARGRTSIHSVRLALSPAAALLTLADPAGVRLPDQRLLDRYLLQSPGQQEALTGFILLLNRDVDIDLKLQTDERGIQQRRNKKLENQVLILMQSAEVGPAVTLAWLRTALPYFHGVSGSLRGLKVDQATQHEDGSSTVSWKGQEYWIPERRAGGHHKPPHENHAHEPIFLPATDVQIRGCVVGHVGTGVKDTAVTCTLVSGKFK